MYAYELLPLLTHLTLTAGDFSDPDIWVGTPREKQDAYDMEVRLCSGEEPQQPDDYTNSNIETYGL